MKLRVPWVLGLSIALLGGCKPEVPANPEPHPMTDAERQAFREAWGVSAGSAAIAHPQSVTLASGPAPLAYIVEQAGSVWIGDNAGRQFGPVNVGPRTVVAVSEDTGVAIGSARLARGPLPEGRIYTVYMGVPADQGWHNGTIAGPTENGAGENKP